MSAYYFEVADIDFLQVQFQGYEKEARRCLEADLVLPAYECTLRCSHLFNLLDSRGAISVTERVALIKRVRTLAIACAKSWVEKRADLGHPLLSGSDTPAESDDDE